MAPQSSLTATSRRSLCHLAAVAIASRSVPAHSWCGEPFPPYAYTLPWFEFEALSEGGATPISMRIVGDFGQERSKKLAPLLIIPSPTLSYEYLETLEALTVSQRRVAFATMPMPTSAAELSLSRLTEQAATALSKLEAPAAHVLGHGFGATVALALYRSNPERVRSLVLASPGGPAHSELTTPPPH